MYNSLQPHGLHHTRLPYPSLSPVVCSKSCPLSRWCYLTISPSVAPSPLLPSIFPSIRVFSNESGLPIRWPKYWSVGFSISPSNEYKTEANSICTEAQKLWVTCLKSHSYCGKLLLTNYSMTLPEFSKFAGILSAALSQHHLLRFEIAHLEFHHLHSSVHSNVS